MKKNITTCIVLTLTACFLLSGSAFAATKTFSLSLNSSAGKVILSDMPRTETREENSQKNKISAKKFAGKTYTVNKRKYTFSIKRTGGTETINNLYYRQKEVGAETIYAEVFSKKTKRNEKYAYAVPKIKGYNLVSLKTNTHSACLKPVETFSDKYTESSYYRLRDNSENEKLSKVRIQKLTSGKYITVKYLIETSHEKRETSGFMPYGPGKYREKTVTTKTPNQTIIALKYKKAK